MGAYFRRLNFLLGIFSASASCSRCPELDPLLKANADSALSTSAWLDVWAWRSDTGCQSKDANNDWKIAKTIGVANMLPPMPPIVLSVFRFITLGILAVG